MQGNAGPKPCGQLLWASRLTRLRIGGLESRQEKASRPGRVGQWEAKRLSRATDPDWTFPGEGRFAADRASTWRGERQTGRRLHFARAIIFARPKMAMAKTKSHAAKFANQNKKSAALIARPKNFVGLQISEKLRFTVSMLGSTPSNNA